jgi:hypothetical protein
VLAFGPAFLQASNQAQCTFKVIVRDKERPTATCPADITALAAPGQPGALANFSLPLVADNVGISVVLCSYEQGELVPIGTNNLACLVMDVRTC